MEKPEDYDQYFNANGSEKPNPGLDDEGHIIDFEKSLIWVKRQREIKLPLMSDKEREDYLNMLRHMQDKMNS